MNAAMILIDGQQGFKVESAASTVIALRMGGFVRTDKRANSERWTKDGKPSVTISNLNPMRTADDCPVIGCNETH
jgi:hypothetical protein